MMTACEEEGSATMYCQVEVAGSKREWMVGSMPAGGWGVVVNGRLMVVLFRGRRAGVWQRGETRLGVEGLAGRFRVWDCWWSRRVGVCVGLVRAVKAPSSGPGTRLAVIKGASTRRAAGCHLVSRQAVTGSLFILTQSLKFESGVVVVVESKTVS